MLATGDESPTVVCESCFDVGVESLELVLEPDDLEADEDLESR